MFSLLFYVTFMNIYHIHLISIIFYTGTLSWHGMEDEYRSSNWSIWVFFFPFFLTYFCVQYVSHSASFQICGQQELFIMKQNVHCAFFPAFELLIRVSLCDLSFHEPTLPVWFPTNYYLATVAGYHIYGPQGLENMSEGDRLGDDDESSLSGRDWFVFPSSFFPGHVGLFPLICAFSICRQF